MLYTCLASAKKENLSEKQNKTRNICLYAFVNINIVVWNSSQNQSKSQVHSCEIKKCGWEGWQTTICFFVCLFCSLSACPPTVFWIQREMDKLQPHLPIHLGDIVSLWRITGGNYIYSFAGLLLGKLPYCLWPIYMGWPQRIHESLKLLI